MSKNFSNNNIFTKGTVTYTDLDISFIPSPVTGDLRVKNDLESIKQSLKSILFTNKYERPFQPNLYGGLNELLFDQMDEVLKDILEDQLRIVIQNYEPRIEVIELKIDDVSTDNNSISIKIKFNMVNVLEPQDINILIRRSR